MIKKVQTYFIAMWKSARASMKTGKRALALVLAATVLIAAFPAFGLTAYAESGTPEVWDGTPADNFGGGEGTEDSPFLISTGGQLAYLAHQVNEGESYSGEYFKLTNDIVLNDVENASNWDEDTSGLNSWTPIGTYDSEHDTDKPFVGTFDGGGHAVGGIYISSDDDYQGLFGCLGNGGTIENVGVTESFIRGKQYVGSVAGYNQNGTIETCYNTGSVTGTGNYVGGVTSFTNGGRVQTCYNTGSVTGTGSYVGGVEGYNCGIIRTCYNTGSVTGTGNYVGGVAGNNSRVIETCYNTGSVTGTGNYVGGVAGCNYGTIQYCYYDTINASEVGGAINGADDTQNIVIGKATGDMQEGTAFDESWENAVWLFEEGKYPLLKALIPSDDGTGIDTRWYNDDESDFTITTAAELAGLAELVNAGNGFSGKTVTLDNDIVLNDVTNASDWDDETTGLNSWTPIGTLSSRFQGVFDGGGHTVGGIYISSDKNYQGLFGSITGTVKNVGVTDSYIRGNRNVGGVAGYIYNGGTIESCYNTGSVAGDNIAGGVVGRNDNGGTIQSCYNAGSVSGNYTVGGVAGYIYIGTIQTCYNTGSVAGKNTVGGVAAANSSGTIQTCYNTGTVSVNAVDGFEIGGVAGFNGGTLSNNYYCGYIGGVGQNETVAAIDVEDGTTPFVSCDHTLDIDGTTTIAELKLEDMNDDFKAAFGITEIQYPKEYESSNSKHVKFSKEEGNKILTGIAPGSATVSGKIAISQKELTSTGFDGSEAKVTGAVRLPVIVSGKAQITAFSIKTADKTYPGTIDEDKQTIAVTVPKGTNVKNLTAEFTVSEAAAVEVNGTKQTSGETVNDFTKPVTYTVKTADDSSQEYTVTVTVHSDPKDDDEKEPPHHHDHSSGSNQKPEKPKPKTETKVDSGKNAASVVTVAAGIKQNGDSAVIQVSVPTVTVDTLDNKTALDLSKDAAVTVELPKNDIIGQINAGKSVTVALTLPSSARGDESSGLSVSINAAKEVLEAAKTSGQNITLEVHYADSHRTAYSWTFKGSDLAKAGTPIKDVNMGVKVLPTANVPKISSITQKNQGVVVQFSQNGDLPAAATVTFSALNQGLSTKQTMDVYRYDLNGLLIPTGKKIDVDALGNTSLSIDNRKEYVLLPDSVRTITLDTRDYTMDIGDSYVTGVTLLNTPAGSHMKTYSSTDGVADVTVLPNGNVRAVGLKPGVTYAMLDLYDDDRHLLTHASVRIVIKEKTTKPHGNSIRQFGIY